MSLLALFCDVDDCYQRVDAWASTQLSPSKRGPKCRLSSEVMTIMSHCHESSYRNFKRYYGEHVCKQLTQELPSWVSDNRFVELMPKVFLRLCAYRQANFGQMTAISFVDSTPLAVCHNKRIKCTKVFAGLAVNLSAALIAYQSQPKKPSLDLQFVPDNLPLLI